MRLAEPTRRGGGGGGEGVGEGEVLCRGRIGAASSDDLQGLAACKTLGEPKAWTGGMGVEEEQRRQNEQREGREGERQGRRGGGEDGGGERTLAGVGVWWWCWRWW